MHKSIPKCFRRSDKIGGYQVKTVEVFMSTFNGEQYLCEQIESILNQKDVCVKLSVRDDGSSDNTLKILEDYEKKGKLKLYKGENIYITKSFFFLVNESDETADYYAFSDQDDFWKEDKLITAIDCLNQAPKGTPALYYSSLDVVNKELKYIRNVFKEKNDFATALVINEVAGCTMVFNKHLLRANKHYDGRNARMHDHWFYLLCCGLDGYIFGDRDSYILYRQHENNTVGGLKNRKKRIKILIRSFCENKNERIKQIQDFCREYGEDLEPDKRYLMSCLINYKKSLRNKLCLINDYRIKLSSEREILFALSLLINAF